MLSHPGFYPVVRVVGAEYCLETAATLPWSVSRARDAHFRTIRHSHKQIAAAAARLGQGFAGDSDHRAACKARRNVDPQRRAGGAGDHLGAALRGAAGGDSQIAPQVGASDFETTARPRPQPDLHKAAIEW